MDTVNALMMELHGYGLSNSDIARMIHTDSVNIRRWDYGYASEEDRMELAELASLCRKLSSKLHDVGQWFDEAIPGTHTTHSICTRIQGRTSSLPMPAILTIRPAFLTVTTSIGGNTNRIIVWPRTITE